MRLCLLPEWVGAEAAQLVELHGLGGAEDLSAAAQDLILHDTEFVTAYTASSTTRCLEQDDHG